MLIAASRQGVGHHVLTLNLDIYRHLAYLTAPHAQKLRSSYTLLLADGMPLVWGAALAGRPVPGRVTGADLLPILTRAALSAGLHVHYTGGPPGAAEGAAAAVIPEGRCSGRLSTSAFRLARDPADPCFREAAGSILADRPDVVFAAYGFPKQDHLGVAVRDLDPSSTIIGCGASLEFAAGMVRRAPAALQRTGLEWVFRLGTDPGRLGRRYLVEDMPVLVPLLRDAVRARRQPSEGRINR
ncbi:WecB/TagA/CpsF family glycosyltransferase [Geodermatophilus africanus]|nr:WecB/TagA/CpsF family glycosyltransferase [Geodermatophilus africanus]